MLLVPQTAAAAWKEFLLSFSFPALSLRSWSYYIYVVLVLFCLICHISGGARHLCFIYISHIICHFVIFLFLYPFRFFLSVNASGLLAFVCMCRIQYDGMPLQYLLCLLHYDVLSLCRAFVTIELVSLYDEESKGHWVCWCQRVERTV